MGWGVLPHNSKDLGWIHSGGVIKKLFRMQRTATSTTSRHGLLSFTAVDVLYVHKVLTAKVQHLSCVDMSTSKEELLTHNALIVPHCPLWVRKQAMACPCQRFCGDHASA